MDGNGGSFFTGGNGGGGFGEFVTVGGGGGLFVGLLDDTDAKLETDVALFILASSSKFLNASWLIVSTWIGCFCGLLLNFNSWSS